MALLPFYCYWFLNKISKVCSCSLVPAIGGVQSPVAIYKLMNDC